MRLREVIPARTPEEQASADQVFAFANQRITLDPAKPAMARIRCNQLTPEYGACPHEAFIEARASEIERNAKRAIFAHLRKAHPYLTEKEAHALASRSAVALRDVSADIRSKVR